MQEISLQERVSAILNKAISQTERRGTLKALHRELRLARERLQQPMRVAIVGLIKAGKSTMMNALLGETLVATGEIETTFNVNWLKYGDASSLRVHFKDNRPAETRSLEDLEMLTRRSDEHRDYLLSIKYIEVYYPNEILHQLNLIDTPGLASFYKDDSLGTIDFLKLHGQELTRTTQQETANADAVLYLFSHSIAESDTSVVEMFQGPMLGQTTPINSIGVLTKADMFWPDRDDALDGGNEIIDRLQNDHPQLRRIFYSVVPVCGLLAWGAQTLTDEEFAILKELAKLPETLFQKIISDVRRFTKREYPDIPVTPASRSLLSQRLGQYGTWQAYYVLRSGITTRQELVEVLLQRSGLLTLKDLVLSHFGNRAYLIKLDTVIKQISEVCFWIRQRENVQGRDREILGNIEGAIGQLKDNEPGFSEFSVLRDYYQDRLQFSLKEVEQLLQVTGEYGLSDRQRLGLPTTEDIPTEADLRETLQKARECAGYWRRRAIDPGASREAESAAGILGDAYDRISYQTMQQIKQRGFAL